MSSPRRKTTLDTVLNRTTLIAVAVLLGGFLAALWYTHDWGTFLKTALSVVVLWIVIAITAALILGDTKQRHRLPTIGAAVAWDEGYQAGIRDAPRRWMAPNLPPTSARTSPTRRHTVAHHACPTPPPDGTFTTIALRAHPDSPATPPT